ncbi:MAG: hypothetical protein H6838_04780 [Planctomycetes bacterium]|nr:hypothetical protein [Planctomycetota bacterium]MCB9884782.1 hypothetical protein [Planctomycetota bacterium]
MTQTKHSPSPVEAENSRPSVWHVLPPYLLQLQFERLSLSTELAALLHTHGIKRVVDLCRLPDEDFDAMGWLGVLHTTELREALDRAVYHGLNHLFAAELAEDRAWPGVQEQLFGCLQPDEAALLEAVLGIDATPCTIAAYALRRGIAPAEGEALACQVRARLRQEVGPLLQTIENEMRAEFQAFDGYVESRHLAVGSTLQQVREGSRQTLLPLRLCAFLFATECTMHGSVLIGMPPRRCRKLVRALHRLVTPGRLPLPLSQLTSELTAEQIEAPRGLLVHLLRTELRVAVELDAEQGETANPDPRSTTRRLQDLLAELGQPTAFEEIVYAYRERYRRANRSTIEQRLREDPTILQLGKKLWSLRKWHEQEFESIDLLVDKAARKLCAEGGRQAVASLLEDEQLDERTIYLVLDRLANDPRVRLLGRGEACPATHKRSQVLEKLLLDFRRAAGEVVETMFLANQTPARRRLVRRLLRENRLFVAPAENRIDTLSNYPLNKERMARLVGVVKEQLSTRTGYAHVAALKATIDKTDLGGTWLTPPLLEDILRRNAPFEVLPGGLVARRQLRLGETIVRLARQALRETGVSMSVEDMVKVRPQLAEFVSFVAPLLVKDPTVHTTRGQYFTLL